MSTPSSISRRAFQIAVPAFSWEEIFEAGPYYARVSELLEDARHYAIFVGWQIDSRLPMPRPLRPEAGAAASSEAVPGMESLREKILRLVESKPGFQFYFLMWDHAYFYVLEREAWQGRIWDNLHPRVHFLFDNRHPLGGSHHEKICVIDGTIAFCGGIDLCDERWDSPQHLYSDPRRSLNWGHEHHGPYHDLAVQVTGPIVEEIQRHIQRRWRALSGIPFPAPVPHPHSLREGEHLVYLSRTLARIDGGSERSITREIEFLFRDLIRAAKSRIILEGQYYWSEEINDMLIAKLREMAGKDFEIILVLADLHELRSLSTEMSLYELRLIEKLEAAALETGARFTIGNPLVQPPRELPNARPRPVYIHSKVMVIDDEFLSIGSANLSTRALRVDTEINLTLQARTEAERIHVRRFAHELLRHWGLSPDSAAGSAIRLRPIRPAEQLRQRLEASSVLERLIQEHFPWKYFFDPKIPWVHPLERKFRRLSKTAVPWIVAATFVLWILSTTAAVTLGGFAYLEKWVWLYALVLTSVWFAPIPYSLVAVLSVFQLGFEQGVAISIASLWVAALQGYWLTRLFPAFLTRFYRTSAPIWLPKRLGLRQFPATVQVSLDPRISLRSKIAYQGLLCVPIPWFAMNFLVVLPSALYVALFFLDRALRLRMISGSPVERAIRDGAPMILLVLAAFAGARLVGSQFRKRRSRA